MRRSPIEMMVDRACGVTSADLAKPATAKPPLDETTNALLRVADSAKSWGRARKQHGKVTKKTEDRLQRAVDALVALGF